MKSLIMKLSFSFALIIALAFVSCAQSNSKQDTTAPKSQTTNTEKIKIPIDGMVCSACQSSVRKTIKSLNGVKEVEVSLENRNAIIVFYPNLIKPEEIQQAVNKGGFTAGKPQQVKQ